MGVLACDRHQCENVMCDYVSHEHGYLCWECYGELNDLMDREWVDVEKFMFSPKKKLSSWERQDINAIFELRD